MNPDRGANSSLGGRAIDEEEEEDDDEVGSCEERLSILLKANTQQSKAKGRRMSLKQL